MPDQPLLLVVDDERGLREGIRRIFQLEGFEVDTAENGTEGIAKGTAREYDIALVDLKMPDYDGITVLRKLREKHPDTEYLIITAFAGIDSAVEATKVGAYTYIPKPFTPDQIIFEVRRALEKRRLAVEARMLRAEQERRLLEISQEKSRLRTIINSINDAVFVTNLEDQIVLANPQTRALFRFPSNVAAGMNIRDLFPAEVLELIAEAAVKAPQGVELVEKEWEMKPEMELIVNMKTAPVRGAEGNIIGYVTTLQDVTALKRLDQQKSQFVSMVAHELKAPLAAIGGYLDTMGNKMLGADLAKYETMIDRSRLRLQALLDLINDLLNISRMELGTAHREIGAVNVAEVIDSTAQLLAQEMEKRGIRYAAEIQSDLPRIDADKDELSRLLMNLLSNAVKYNRENGDVRISATTSDGHLLLAVADAGIGMKEEERANLFREFYRAKNEKTRAIPGTGLGLSIVKRLVESYHGSIEVESEYGKGTTFIVTLPLKYISEG